MKHTEDWSGERQEELLLYLKRGGPEESSIGTPDSKETTIKTRRQVGRPKRRWEDDLNEFFKTEETLEKTKYDFMNNNSWMTEANKYKECKEKEEKSMKIW